MEVDANEVLLIRERLVRTETMVSEMHKALLGNGREGLIETVAALKADHRNLRDAVEDLKTDLDDRAPTKKQKNVLMGAGGLGVASFFGWFLTEVLPYIKL